MFKDFDKNLLIDLTKKQVNSLFFLSSLDEYLIDNYVEETLEKLYHCFSLTPNKYYRKNNEVFFNPYHSAQYCIYLYFLSHKISSEYEGEEKQTADKIYALNKALNGLDLFHEIKMPEVFFLDHPVGSVIGRAKIGDFFSFSQHCTVGNNKNKFPIIGERVAMMSGSKILGESIVGDNVTVAANAYIKDMEIPSNTYVFGQYPNNILKEKPKI